MSTPYDHLRCHGVRDEADTVRPLPMCQQCVRWQQAAGATEFIAPRLIVAHNCGVQQSLSCTRRIAAPAEEV